ncbi:MAG TPA: homoserine O-succinyltransferase [Gemmatimonadaceae bacterium]|nr:homoserine O-succinyltransferase [Gemmatimonadaceae bacterium]
MEVLSVETSRTTVHRDRARVSHYELIGAPGAPVVVVLGGISATRHVTISDDDPSPGWWNEIVGRGRAVDTMRYRVLGVDFLDGGWQSDGRPQRIVTTHDQAANIARILDEIGVDRIHSFVGASYGGMVALAFAERYPDRVGGLVAISAPHEPHPMSTALRALQRRIVELGLDTGRASEALAIARGLAITTYRSAREFGERFDSAPIERSDNEATFPVESYLRHHGERFAARWRAERFLALSLSTDLHRVDPAAVRTPTTIVAAEGDAIVPGEQLETLAARLGGPMQLIHLPTTRGHDAFLTEPAAVGAIIHTALSTTKLS